MNADTPTRRLEAARLIGAAVLCTLGQLAAHMPEGYFGSGDRVTAIGWGFSGAILLLAAAGVVAWLRGRPRARWITGLVASIAIGFFVPVLASDPVIAGLVVIWHLTQLTRVLVAPLLSAPDVRSTASTHGADLPDSIEASQPAITHLATVCLLSSVAIVGYRLSDRVVVHYLVLALNGVVALLSIPHVLRMVERRSRLVALLAVPALATLATLRDPLTAISIAAVFQIGLLAAIVTQGALFNELVVRFLDRPAVLVLSTFLGTILIGTMLLSFPVASATGEGLAPIDALFMSTSAVCVTGLVVVDPGTQLSVFGQVVLLLLVQVGGLGIMVLATFATILVGGRLGLRGQNALREILDITGVRSAYRLTLFIVGVTAAIEAGGAILLAWRFHALGEPLERALWFGVFHSITAFCNAGFGLYARSLIPLQHDPIALFVVAALVVLGGIGFVVLARAWPGRDRRGMRATDLQSRVAILVSALLIVVGALVYLLVEWNYSLAGLSGPERLINALFQSVTTRTAGFNSVDLATAHPATLVFVDVLMFIGASPGGTGGGIKTTTFAILVAAIPAIARGESRVALFRRTVAQETVYRSAAIAVISLVVAIVALFVLLLTQPISFDALLFETVSALGTVGLSIGATSQLDGFGCLVIVAVMFLGRVGPLTLALALGQRRHARVGFPEARVMVG